MNIDNDHFSTYASASGTATAVGNVNLLQAYAFGQDLDFITINSGTTSTGIMNIPIHLTGSVNIGYTLTGTFESAPVPASAAYADVSLQLACSSYGPVGPSSTCGSRNFDFTTPSNNIDEIINLQIAFASNTPFFLDLELSLVAGFGIRIFDVNGDSMISGHAIGDFAHTGIFEGATVTDEFGNLLPDAVISSVSGFDYRAGYSPTNPSVGEAPEPATLAIFGLGLIGLRCIRRKWA